MYKTYLYGGVGNQLFQYFLLASHAQQFEVCEILLDGYETHSSNIHQILNVSEVSKHSSEAHLRYNTLYKFIIKALCKLGISEFIGIKTDKSNKLFSNPNQAYFGYWQDLSLFEPYRQKIIEANWIHDTKFLDTHNRRDILEDDTFVLHVRKGDYLLKKNRKIFANLDADFYITGLSELDSRVGNLIICTDDQDWVNVNLLPKLLPLCDNIVMSKCYGCENWIDDFLLMRFSKNLIMSNSTFCWWAAFLNDNNVYYPRSWYKKHIDFSMKRETWNWFGVGQ